jgi:predicted kinase
MLDNMKSLYIIRGVPGSGKSTFAKELVPEFLVCEADKFFVSETGYNFDPNKLKEAHDWCQKIVETYMQDPERYPKIAVSNTFTREWEMKPYFELAEKYGYKVFSVIVENYHGNRSVHNISESTIDKMIDRFEINL